LVALAVAGAGVLLGTLHAGQTRRPPAAGPARPDLVLVVVDALRADRLPIYGYGRATTPQLDRRRSELRWFADATTLATHTVPSVASMFTGVSPRIHHLQYDTKGLYFPPYGATPKLDTELRTLAEVLTDAGYLTKAVVGNPWLTETTRFNRGFSTFDGWKTFDRSGINDDEGMVKIATDALAARRDRPLFFYVHLMTVHNPYDKGHHEFVRHPGVVHYINGPISVSPADAAFMSDLYDSNVAYTDKLLSGLFDLLAAARAERPAVVCIVGDHGDELQDHGGFGHGTTLYQELSRVPVLFWGAPITRHGPSAYPLQLSDVRGMLLTLAGVEADPLLGLVSTRVQEPAAPPNRMRSIELNNLKGIYEKPWKYVVTRRPFTEQLFNLDTDPAEKVNRSAQTTAVLLHMRDTARGLWPDIPFPAARTGGLEPRGSNGSPRVDAR
jgi:arylsulfatase A-like enzyme